MKVRIPSPAMNVATFALLFALGGSAAVSLASASVRKCHLRDTAGSSPRQGRIVFIGRTYAVVRRGHP